MLRRQIFHLTEELDETRRVLRITQDCLDEERRLNRTTEHRLDVYVNQSAVIGRNRGKADSKGDTGRLGARPLKFMCMIQADTPVPLCLHERYLMLISGSINYFLCINN